ncbi:probable WRKY transcription factor 2 [Phtheirospermum japonicum]|uniref:Probable WRKY transcription factor 2 n=1 Tax=Phtheirospermum japonicum TaxID=374723 RepID=A0A830CY77_9LAMI|nr:probable WRKY transcription factor 2 [Phtheirospermum japonicum]
MGGSDDHVAIMEDWFTPPRTFSSSMMSDNIAARSVTGFDSEKYSAPLNANQNGPTQSNAGANSEASDSVRSKSSSRGGLLERMAARAGFNAPRLNTESIRPTQLYTKPDIRSPYLTIPPGLSPTTLLESPVFLSNSLAQPSPTTGKFPFFPSGSNRDPALMTENLDKGKENTFEDTTNGSSFAFKHVSESAPLAHFNASNKSFPGVEVTNHSERQSTDTLKFQSDNNNALFQQANFCESHVEHNRGGNLLPDQTYFSVGVTENSPPFDEQPDDGDQRSSDQDPNNVVGSAAAEDGYNWRKYGQKHVKGSEYPRSYYKCTHQNCPVKKKVERSQEGYVTEIIYKGAHNHPKPLPNRRSALESSSTLGDMQIDSEQRGPGATSDLIWSVMQGGNNLEYSNGAAANLPAQSGAQSGDGVEESLTLSNNEDDDRAAHGSVSLGNEGEGEDSESKRRRIETYIPEICGATRAIREPRVVVQTTSEVDILDDGYRWRKYGQKVVKGNPNPRSYYKCTSPGCNVRKHVERASHDLKSVITTYEGKHNHEVPAARNSGNANSGGPNTQQAPVTTNHVHQPEPCLIRGRSSWFERPPLASFGLPGQLQVGPGFGFGMNQPGLGSLGLAGFGPQYGPFSGNQTRPVNEMGYMLPKDELKLEPVMESGLNSTVGSSYYQQLMSQLPLGPQM